MIFILWGHFRPIINIVLYVWTTRVIAIHITHYLTELNVCENNKWIERYRVNFLLIAKRKNHKHESVRILTNFL